MEIVLQLWKRVGQRVKKKILDVIACPQISGNPPRKNSQTKNNQCTGQTSLSNTPCGQKPSHMAKQTTAFILQSPQKALDLLHGSLTELPPQAMILFSDKDLIQKRQAIANNIVVGLNKNRLLEN